MWARILLIGAGAVWLAEAATPVALLPEEQGTDGCLWRLQVAKDRLAGCVLTEGSVRSSMFVSLGLTHVRAAQPALRTYIIITGLQIVRKRTSTRTSSARRAMSSSATRILTRGGTPCRAGA